MSFGVLFALTYFIFNDTLPNLKPLCFFIIRNLNSMQVLQVQVLPFCFLLSRLVLLDVASSTVITLKSLSL